MPGTVVKNRRSPSGAGTRRGPWVALPIGRLSYAWANSRAMLLVWRRQDAGFGPELGLQGHHFQRHLLQPPSTTVFRNPSRQFAKRCELSELSELSRLAEAACGQDSKGLWPALGLSMGFAHRIDADCVYFQFAKRCELSELSELSRLAEAACGQDSKGLWPALGLSMGFAHRIDADCVYFRANKMMDGLFFLF